MQIQVDVLDVDQPLLMLSQPVQGLAVVGHPFLPHAAGRLTLHRRRRHRARLLGQHDRPRRIQERHRAGALIDAHREPAGGDRRNARRAGVREGRRLAPPGRRRQGRPREKRRITRAERNPHHIRGTNPDAQQSPRHRQRDAVRKRRVGPAAVARRRPMPASARQRQQQDHPSEPAHARYHLPPSSNSPTKQATDARQTIGPSPRASTVSRAKRGSWLGWSSV
jgi:hypothetical protein